MDEIDISYDTVFCKQCKLKDHPNPEICLQDREKIYANAVALGNPQNMTEPAICTQARKRAFATTTTAE
jgi:hypothetical protein